MLGHPRIYLGEFEWLSETIQEPEHLISEVASIHRLTLTAAANKRLDKKLFLVYY